MSSPRGARRALRTATTLRRRRCVVLPSECASRLATPDDGPSQRATHHPFVPSRLFFPSPSPPSLASSLLSAARLRPPPPPSRPSPSSPPRLCCLLALTPCLASYGDCRIGLYFYTILLLLLLPILYMVLWHTAYIYKREVEGGSYLLAQKSCNIIATVWALQINCRWGAMNHQ